jgi:Protein of unknown function (DUF2281)
MSVQSVQTLLIPEAVLAVLQALSPEQRQQVFDFAEFLAQRQEPAGDQSLKPAKSPRIPGLHAGQVWMSEDFDAPLPDEFWFGENDPLMMTDQQIQQLNQRSPAS